MATYTQAVDQQTLGIETRQEDALASRQRRLRAAGAEIPPYERFPVPAGDQIREANWLVAAIRRVRRRFGIGGK